MKRYVTYGLAILATLAVLGVGAACWARPDLLAGLRRLPLPEILAARDASEEPDEGQQGPEEGEELIEDGWCLVHRGPVDRCEWPRQPPEESHACAPGKLPVIRLSGPEIADRIGLETVRVDERAYVDVIQGNAEVQYNEHAFAEVRPRVAGLVHQVTVEHGDRVRRGDLVAVIDSAEIGTIKAEYLSALPVVELAESTLERTQSLTRVNALPLKDELEARTALNRARADLLNASQRLRNLGFTDSDLVRIAEDQDTSSLLRIVAPIDGTVIERHAVPGEAVEPTHQLVALADLSTMWALIDVYENDIERVRPGQEVTFRIAGVEGRVFPGEVEWIDAAVNPSTRTIRIRAELDNVEGRLKANEFGLAEIQVGEPHPALFVPASAIQSVREDHLVFLARPDGSYRPQRVLIEEREGLAGEKMILWGVDEGEEVVTTGSFLLKSEMLRDQLAGD